MIDTIIQKIKSNDYRYFFVKLLIFIILVAMLDFIIGKSLNCLYYRQKESTRHLITYTLDRTSDDLLIFGTSRSNHHYHPDVIEKGLNQTSFIVGRDNVNIVYNYAVLISTLKRYSPKTVILDILCDELRYYPNSNDKLSILLPYYDTHPEICPLIELKSPYEKVKLLSHIYPFNSLILTIIKNNFVAQNDMIEKDPDYRKTRGYLPLTRVWNKPNKIKDNDSQQYELDSVKIEILRSFIEKCKESGTRLYLVVSPYYDKLNSPTYSMKTVRIIAEEHGVAFYDYSRDTNFVNNPRLFSDPDHLNDQGATLFSKMIVDSISRRSNSKK
jgi:hypothetical protein